MRVIAGKFKGKKLTSAPGLSTRPTADRVREAIFSICAAKIEGAVVLDLFAGTGAFGIEALSRGAAAAGFIDISAAAIQVIQKNISGCRMENRCRLIRWDIVKNLNCIRLAEPRFNLVFMDPPYNKNAVAFALKNLKRSDALEKDAILIIEHTFLEPIPGDLDCFVTFDQRKYGKTLVSFLTYVI